MTWIRNNLVPKQIESFPVFSGYMPAVIHRIIPTIRLRANKLRRKIVGIRQEIRKFACPIRHRY